MTLGLRVFLCLAVVTGVGCSKKTATGTVVTPEEEKKADYRFAVASTFIRYQPTNDEYIADPYNDANLLANKAGAMYRGEVWRVFYTEGEWAQIGENAPLGWAPAKYLIPVGNLSKATVVADTKGTSLTPTARGAEYTIEAGTLLLVIEEQGTQTLVNAGPDQEILVNSASIVRDASEVDVSELLISARFLNAVSGSNDEGSTDIFDQARRRYAGSKVLEKFADEVDFTKVSARSSSPRDNYMAPPDEEDTHAIDPNVFKRGPIAR